MNNENLSVRGRVNLVLTGKDGKVKDQRDIKNLVVTDGLEFITSRMTAATADVMSHMAVGSDNTAAAAGDAALGTELGRTTVSASVSSNVITYTSTFSAGTGTGSVVEAGIFNAASGGTMLCRTVFSAVNKAADDTLSVTWTVTISAS